MAVFFQSLRSGSSGNCLMLWSKTTRLLIDCGLRTQKECRELLGSTICAAAPDVHQPDRIDAVVVSHVHGDHIGYAALRTLAKLNVPVYSHEHVVDRLRIDYAHDLWKIPPDVRQFSRDGFSIGDFELTPISVPHAPGCPNFGFVITHGRGEGRRKIVVVTDFYDYADVLDHFTSADFIFVEANYDPELLRRNPNYASRFHMPNHRTAKLLFNVVTKGGAPKAVMLGHLSRERNTSALAIGAVQEAFWERDVDIPFALDTAPAFEPSRAVRV